MVQPASQDNDEELEETTLMELEEDSQQQQRSEPAVMTEQAATLELVFDDDCPLLETVAPHVPPQTCHVRRLLPIPVGRGLSQDQHCLLPFSSSRHWYPDGQVESSQVNPEETRLSFLQT